MCDKSKQSSFSVRQTERPRRQRSHNIYGKKLVPRESNAKTVQGRSHKQGGDIEAIGSLLVISERERKGRLLRRSPNKPSVRQWNQGKCTVLGATGSQVKNGFVSYVCRIAQKKRWPSKLINGAVGLVMKHTKGYRAEVVNRPKSLSSVPSQCLRA